jgi:hypothetical protein
MVIEPSAYGSGLSAAALNCIRQRVGTVVLDPLDDTVSATASTVIEIKYQPPVILESDPGVPEPKLRNVKEPLPKRPDIPPSGKPIEGGTDRPIEGGTAKDPDGPSGRGGTRCGGSANGSACKGGRMGWRPEATQASPRRA